MGKITRHKEIFKCRICESQSLRSVLDLGNQILTGLFLKNITLQPGIAPLVLVLCMNCGLVQLKHTYNLKELYGEFYGYRSGLNSSMVKHLFDKVGCLEENVNLNNDEIVVDIGSNDATLLKAYTNTRLKKVGIDPVGFKFQKFYSPDIYLISDFFSAHSYRELFPNQNAKIVTSISMFYDLEYPREFVRNIYEILDQEGIWHFEQSYLPEMLRMNSYDTVCHEHLEYYSLNVVKNLLEECDFKIVNVETNTINGGSFAVTAAKKSSSHNTNDKSINELLEKEKKMELDTVAPFEAFKQRVIRHRDDLRNMILNLTRSGKVVLGYGASTKGNVLLQYCGFTTNEIPFIGEVNKDKFGSYAPGSNIPIIPEEEARKMKPDYMLVLPWHFRKNIIEKELDYLASGGKLIFPLPKIEIVED